MRMMQDIVEKVQGEIRQERSEREKTEEQLLNLYRFTCPKLATLQRTFTKALFGDAYSPNTMCGPLPAGTTEVLEKDRFGKVCRRLTVAQHKANVASFQGVLDWYFEYPPLFRDCPGTKRPALIKDVAQLA